MLQVTKTLPQHGAVLWTYLQTELQKGNALLLPLRLFIGLGWLRAGVEKLIDPAWLSGEKLTLFFQTQLSADAVYFPFYETLITQVFAPNALIMSWIVMMGEMLAGLGILAGTFTSLALLGGLFMNLNFVLAGVVNPSAFYMVIQGTLLAENAGSTVGGDSILARNQADESPAQPTDRSAWAVMLLACGIACTTAATWVVPYIRDFGPHSIEDPAMLLFILSMLGAMLAGIQFIRNTATQPLEHISISESDL